MKDFTRTKSALTFFGMAAAALAFANQTQANFDVGTTLFGDPRDENPNGLEVRVFGEIVGTTGTFSVDLAPMAASHPDVLLDEFYFSLVAPASDYTVTITDPLSWVIKTPADVVGGGNNAGFLFEASGPNADRPDVSTPLLFTVEKLSDFVETDFTNAATFTSNDVILGGGQMGAHLQSLNLADCAPTCTEDSGFVLGDWTATADPQSVASPGTMALLGMGLVGLGLARRRKA